MTPDPHQASDRQLWERFASGARPPAGPCPTVTDLAAFIDGRASENLRTSVEAHLAECGECLDTVIEARAALATPEAAPLSVNAAAKRLVRRPRPAEPVHTMRWRPAELLVAARWGLAAAASIAISVIAYRAGLQASAAPTLASSDLVSEMSFGVFDSSGLDTAEFELLASLSGEVQP